MYLESRAGGIVCGVMLPAPPWRIMRGVMGGCAWWSSGACFEGVMVNVGFWSGCMYSGMFLALWIVGGLGSEGLVMGLVVFVSTYCALVQCGVLCMVSLIVITMVWSL